MGGEQMKFLVLGCNGMAGHMIALYLKEQGHSVWGFDLKESDYVDSIAGDARDTQSLKKIITEGNLIQLLIVSVS